MIPRGRSAALVSAALLLAACGRSEQPGQNAAAVDDIVTTDGAGGTAAKSGSDAQVVSVGPDGRTLSAAATPMAEREAVIGLLNKRNGQARELKLKPGQSARVGDVIVRLRACEKTAPWEADQYTGAFVQVDVQQPGGTWRRVFSGWLFNERPALNVVQHPVYDVWPKSCAMTFRETGPDTVPVGEGPRGSTGGGEGSGNRSSAPQSPSTKGAPAESPAEESPSAAPSNAT